MYTNFIVFLFIHFILYRIFYGSCGLIQIKIMMIMNMLLPLFTQFL